MIAKRKAYPCEDYEELFDLPQAEDRRVDNRGVCGYRMKTITSGNIRECEIYPVFTNRADFTRGKKKRESRDKQRRINRRNAQKKLIRLLNANFTEGDTWATFTYGADKLPPDEKAAHKFFRNYLRRLDYRMKREAWRIFPTAILRRKCGRAARGRTPEDCSRTKRGWKVSGGTLPRARSSLSNTRGCGRRPAI